MLARMLLDVRYCFDRFWLENGIGNDVRFGIDFNKDFVSFGARLGSLLALFWEPLGGLGASLGRQVGAKRDPKSVSKEVLAPKSLQVASGTSFLRIWEARGPLLGRFL